MQHILSCKWKGYSVEWTAPFDIAKWCSWAIQITFGFDSIPGDQRGRWMLSSQAFTEAVEENHNENQGHNHY